MNIKYIYLIALLLSLSQSTFGKIITLVGKVLNEDNQALEYVNIGIINKAIGTVSNKNGEFNLEIFEKQISDNDSLRFSMIGYESKSFLLKTICNKQYFVVTLNKKIEFIPEVEITGKKLKTKEKGTKHYPLPLVVMLTDTTKFNQNLGSAIARSFNINHENTMIETISFFACSNYDTTTIRINLYTVKNRKPFKTIINEGIYVELNGVYHGWVNVNLKDYNIIVSEDIIIGIEWVGKSEKGDYLFFPLARPSLAHHYYKIGSQNKWERWPHMSCLMEVKIKY